MFIDDGPEHGLHLQLHKLLITNNAGSIDLRCLFPTLIKFKTFNDGQKTLGCDALPSSLCDPKRVKRVGFAEIKNFVPLPASSTKRGKGVVLEASGLDYEEMKLFGHKPASKTNTRWLELILHAFGVGTSHGLTRTHMTHHSPGSGDATTIFPIVFSAFTHGSGIQMALFPRTPKVESRNCSGLDFRDFGTL
jgi:hypothetical protein